MVPCQQGLQFFPDKPGALREMRRVLVPSGRLVLSVWRGLPHCPWPRAVAEALERHMSAEVQQVSAHLLPWETRQSYAPSLRGQGFARSISGLRARGSALPPWRPLCQGICRPRR